MNETIEKIRIINHLPPSAMVIILATLSACVSIQNPAKKPISGRLNQPQLTCANAHQHRNKVVGDGHCVSLIKRCSGAPHTDQWRPGKRVVGNHIERGTIIATFENNRYPSVHGYHAAIYIEQDEQGIWVWDQWVGKPVHRRLIRLRDDDALPSNSARAYRVVVINRASE